MSLDVYLELESGRSERGSGIFVRESGATREISREEWDAKFPGGEPVVAEIDDDDSCVYSRNITHNLGAMAEAAEIYGHLWRPDEIGVTKAIALVDPLTEGLAKLRAEPDRFKFFSPANGWGDYNGLVAFVEDYLSACRRFPAATVRVSR